MANDDFEGAIFGIIPVMMMAMMLPMMMWSMSGKSGLLNVSIESVSFRESGA